ncbi:hypothetical protein GYMLUDRAFT_248880 [Collybiopsis luxurians FD-317 M1]|uniref:F-actin-capping protein subunit beta n=1 Tax=Collybiopsis luxurians FD-317 M1 TaxID=944289 RepID=A0A0D0BYW8_9AGAR|nr:hypothetical protein GYMLUDRAFT_248880 [Collybiopsis luxurians FD-317 M1]
MADLVDSMLDLMRRLPPTRTEENVSSLISICPDYADDLLGSVDQPLQLKTDRATGREYLACDYNRDGESYRSPWSNEYDPPLEDGTVSTPKLRKLEISANEAFDTYRTMKAASRVVSLRKTMTPSASTKSSEPWGSIHFFEGAERGGQTPYMHHYVTMKKSSNDKEQKKKAGNAMWKPLWEAA